MRFKSGLVFHILLFISLGLSIALPPVMPGRAQMTEKPLVVFVVDRTLDTAPYRDARSIGLSRLDDMFRSMGARTESVSLTEPLPEDAHVVVIVRQRQRMPVAYAARLWLHLQRGSHILWAIDPSGHLQGRTDVVRDALPTLFASDYGISLQDDFLMESWFTSGSLTNQNTSYSRAYADVVADPVIAPLAAYGLPVQIWGGRSMRIEPVGVDSRAVPLLVTDSAYGETGKVFDKKQPAPFEINLEADRTGRLNVAALSENRRTGSRVAVLGDSAILQNGFGLAVADDGITPIYPGDYILTQRLVAWLLDLPEESWPALPTGFTWLSLDGQANDWNPALPVTTDAVRENKLPASLDLKEVRAFRNEDFLYLWLGTTAPPDAAVHATLDVDSDQDGTADLTLSAGADGVSVEGGDPILDAAGAVGTGLEVRLPLRVVGVTGRITKLCLSGGTAGQQDCLDGSPTISTVAEVAPCNLELPEGPMVTVATDGRVNVREGPGLRYLRSGSLANGAVLAATGRDEPGDWIRVENSRVSGWTAAYLLLADTDITSLPVIASPSP